MNSISTLLITRNYVSQVQGTISPPLYYCEPRDSHSHFVSSCKGTERKSIVKHKSGENVGFKHVKGCTTANRRYQRESVKVVRYAHVP